MNVWKVELLTVLNNVLILRVVSTVGVIRQAMRWSETMKLVKVRLCLIVLDNLSV